MKLKRRLELKRTKISEVSDEELQGVLGLGGNQEIEPQIKVTKRQGCSKIRQCDTNATCSETYCATCYPICPSQEC